MVPCQRVFGSQETDKTLDAVVPLPPPRTVQGGDTRRTGDLLASCLATGSERPYLKGMRRMVEQDTNIFP